LLIEAEGSLEEGGRKAEKLKTETLKWRRGRKGNNGVDSWGVEG
jgi:hypothetical protein